MTEKSTPTKYQRYRKDEAISRAYIDGLKIGLAISKGGDINYGFGPRGLGTYVYNDSNSILAFLPDY